MIDSWSAWSLVSLAVLMLSGCADTGQREPASAKGPVQSASSSPVAVSGPRKEASTSPPTPEQWVAGKNRYKPPGDQFPQIIQDNDYATISATHQLYFLLAGRKKSFFDVHPFEFDLDGTQLVVKSAARSASVLVSDKGAKVGGSLYKNAASKLLFETLISLFADLSAQFPLSGARASHWSNRSYRDVTSFEFYFPPLVVELTALSSAPTEPERLYVLDLVWAKDSRFWATEDP
jgi:hypothetical protein